MLQFVQRKKHVLRNIFPVRPVLLQFLVFWHFQRNRLRTARRYVTIFRYVTLFLI